MPFDSVLYDPDPDLIELQPGKAGLRQLSYLLRHPEKWPEGHVWDFADVLEELPCGTSGCAIGIGCLVWGENNVDEKLGFSGFNEPEYYDIFYDGPATYGCPNSQVTPTMVACAIDHYLATGRVPVAGEATP